MRIESQGFINNKDPSVLHVNLNSAPGTDLKSKALDNLRPELMHTRSESKDHAKDHDRLKQATGITSNSKDHDRLEQAMDITRKRLEGTDINIRLAMEAKNRIQIEVFKTETNEVVRKFPPDEILRLADAIEEMNGSIFDGRY